MIAGRTVRLLDRETRIVAEHSAVDRVLEALEDHTLLAVIAAAADLPVAQTLLVLSHLERQGLAERHMPECWGLR